MAIKWDDVAHAGAGFADELLFGAPEFLLKNLGDRKAIQAWIDKNPKAYHGGETAGTIAGALVPYGAIAKGIGLGAKALKGAEVAKDVGKGLQLAKGAEVATDAAKLAEGAKLAQGAVEGAKSAGLLKDIGRMAAKSAGLGALESGVRGTFDEESADDISKDVSRGLLFGGLGGAAGGALSKGLKYLGKSTGRLAGEAEEQGMKSFLGRTDLKNRNAQGYLRDIAGSGAKGFGKEAKADEALKDLYDIGKKYKLHRPGMEKGVLEANRKAWKDIDNVFDKAFPDARGSTIIDKATDWNELQRIADMPGGEVAMASLQKIMDDTKNTQGLYNIRNYLSDVMETARNAPDKAAGRAQMDLAAMLRRNVDSLVMDTAEKAGLPIDFKTLKKEYLPLRAYAEAAAKDTVMTTRTNTGSPTMEKILGAGIGGTIGGAAPTDDPVAKARNMLLGGLAGFAGKRGAEKLVDLTKSGMVPVAAKLLKAAPKIESVAEGIVPAVGATMGGRLAANTANAVEAANPTTEPELEAAKAGAEVGQATPKEYMGLVLNRLKQYAASEGIAEDSPDFEDFVNYVGQNTMGDEGPFDAKKLAGVLYPDPDERSKFVKALDVSRGLKSSLGSALRPATGVLGIGEDLGARMERDTALDKLTALVGDVAKATGTEKVAKANLQRILSARGLSQAAKKEMIRGLLEGYGIDFDTLARVGINV